MIKGTSQITFFQSHISLHIPFTPTCGTHHINIFIYNYKNKENRAFLRKQLK